MNSPAYWEKNCRFCDDPFGGFVANLPMQNCTLVDKKADLWVICKDCHSIAHVWCLYHYTVLSQKRNVIQYAKIIEDMESYFCETCFQCGEIV
jgi:hypothetical protein